MKSIKIKKDLANIYFISILAYLSCFITIDNNYFQGYVNIKMGCMMILLVYIFVYHKIMLRRRYIKVNLCFGLLSLLIIISSFINNDYPYNSGNYVLSSINFIISVLGMLFAVEFASYKQKMHILIRIYYMITLCIVIITDLYIFLTPNKSAMSGDIYFIGTKFTVVYFHLFLVVLYMLKQVRSIRKYILPVIFLSIVTLIISIQVDCMTGIVGIFSFMFMYIISNKFSHIMTRPYIYIITLVASGLFVVFYSVIMRLGFVENFLENILHTSTELTGRTWIYSVLPFILRQNLWLGNGFRSSFDVMMQIMHAPNTQNGLTEWLLEGGILTTAAFLVLVWMILKAVKYVNINSKKNKYIVIYSLLYVLAILSTVEIMLNREIYFVWLAILFGVLTERDNNIDIKNIEKL